MFVKSGKIEVLNVDKDFDNYFSEEKLLMVNKLETIHNLNYYENKILGTGAMAQYHS